MGKITIASILILPLVLGACDAGEDGWEGEEPEADGDVPVVEGMPRGGGAAPVVTDFGDWDADADGRLTSDEFATWLRDEAWFDTFDTTGDEILTREEFAEGAFSRWDDDGDGRLSADEWSGGAASWFRGVGAFDAWDGDGDGSLTAAEFRAGLDEEGSFAEWGIDERGIAATDFEQRTFDLFDEDDDAVLNEAEWSAANRDWRAEP